MKEKDVQGKGRLETLFHVFVTVQFLDCYMLTNIAHGLYEIIKT